MLKYVRVCRIKLQARFTDRECLQIPNPLDGSEYGQKGSSKKGYLTQLTVVAQKWLSADPAKLQRSHRRELGEALEDFTS